MLTGDAQVLLLEPDEVLSRTLALGLGRAGYGVQQAGAATAALHIGSADVIVVDLDHQDGTDLGVLRWLRDCSTAQLIAIGAPLAGPERAAVLDAGAYTYVAKPFGLGEITAWIRAASQSPGRSPVIAPFGHGVLHLDPLTRRALADGRELTLNEMEFDVLERLAIEPGRVVSRHELLARIRRTDWRVPARAVDAIAAAMRRTLDGIATVESVATGGFRLLRHNPHPPTELGR